MLKYARDFEPNRYFQTVSGLVLCAACLVSSADYFWSLPMYFFTGYVGVQQLIKGVARIVYGNK